MPENSQTTEAMTAEETPALRTEGHRLMKVAGIGMAGLLALSACANVGGDDDAEDTEDGQEQAAEDQDADQDGEDADADPAEEEEDEIPLLGEIVEDSFAAMDEAESVTLTGDGQGDILGDDFDDIEDDLDVDDDEDDDDADEELDSLSMVVTGTVDGESTVLEMELDGMTIEMLQVGGTAYMSGEAAVTALEAEGAAAEFDLDGIADEVAGRWIDTGQADEDITIRGFLDSMQESYEEGGGEIPDDADTEGELTEYDGQEAWHYTNGETDIYFAADPEAPYLLAVEGEDETDGPFEIALTDWNEAEVPEEPQGDELISESEFEEILMDHVA